MTATQHTGPKAACPLTTPKLPPTSDALHMMATEEAVRPIQGKANLVEIAPSEAGQRLGSYEEGQGGHDEEANSIVDIAHNRAANDECDHQRLQTDQNDEPRNRDLRS